MDNVQVTLDELYAHIGQLTVECGKWKQAANEQEARAVAAEQRAALLEESLVAVTQDAEGLKAQLDVITEAEASTGKPARS